MDLLFIKQSTKIEQSFVLKSEKGVKTRVNSEYKVFNSEFKLLACFF